MIKLLFNQYEKIISQDLNDVQAVINQNMNDRTLYPYFGSPAGGVLGSSFIGSYVSALASSIAAGTGYFYDSTQVGYFSKFRQIYSAAAIPVTHTAAHATLNRIDLVCLSPNFVTTSTASRYVKTGGTGPIVLSTVNKTAADTYTLTVVAGTPAASPVAPATPAGSIALYRALIHAVTGLTGSGDITDVRTIFTIAASGAGHTFLTNGSVQGQLDQTDAKFLTNHAKGLDFWDNTTSYGVFSTVMATNGRLYKSIVSSNLNHQPQAADGYLYWSPQVSAQQSIFPSDLRNNNVSALGQLIGASFTIRKSGFDGAGFAWQGLATNGSRIVCTGSGATQKIMTSDDGGITWTARTSATGAAVQVIFAAGKPFVATSGGAGANLMQWSNDGISWTASTNPAGNWNVVTYSKELNLYVATKASSRDIITSVDGKTWTLTANALPANYTTVSRMIWAKNPIDNVGKFVAIGTAASGSSIIWSSDGLTWNSASSVPTSAGTGTAIAFATTSQFFAASYGTDIWVSNDGDSWNAISTTNHANVLLVDIVYAEEHDMFVAVSQTVGKLVQFSPSGQGGQTWFLSETDPLDGCTPVRVIYSPTYNRFISCAFSIGNTGQILTSSFNTSSSLFNSQWKCILQASGSHTAARVAGLYQLGLGDAAAIAGTGTLTPLAIMYLDGAEYPKINGVAASMRLRVELTVNSVAPTGNYTFQLIKLTIPTGGAGLLTYSTSIVGASITQATPAANTIYDLISPTFDFTSVAVPGIFCLGFTTTATVAASSHVHISSRLEMKN